MTFINKFIIRIELWGGGATDYRHLKEYMEQEGFLQTVSTPNGCAYRLPTGEFYAESIRQQPDYIRRVAREAAYRTGRHPAILVTRLDSGDSMSWEGLLTG